MSQITLFGDTREEWRPIQGYEGLYEVSNLGRIRRLEMVVNGAKGWRTYPGGIRRSVALDTGYLAVNLSALGKCRQHLIHVLVARAFIPNPDQKPHINHLDGNKANNLMTNLEWCTRSENMRHARNTGLYRKP